MSELKGLENKFSYLTYLHYHFEKLLFKIRPCLMLFSFISFFSFIASKNYSPLHNAPFWSKNRHFLVFLESGKTYQVNTSSGFGDGLEPKHKFRQYLDLGKIPIFR